jgi:hypothetical protein
LARRSSLSHTLHSSHGCAQCDAPQSLRRRRVPSAQRSRLATPHASLYADDLVLFLSPVRQDLKFIQGILSVFGAAFGLHTNFVKCSITPIRCSVEDLEPVQSCFPCTISDFPCTYLNILLFVRKLLKAALQPLVDKVSHRLSPWKGRLTTLAGHSVLVQFVLSSIPVHVSMTIGLPV